MNVLSITSVAIRVLATAWSVRLVLRTRDWRLAFLPLLLSLLTLEQLLPSFGEMETRVREIATLTVVVVGIFYFLFRQYLRDWGSPILRLVLGLIVLYQITSLMTGQAFLGPVFSHADLSFSLVLCLVVVLLERILDERRQTEEQLRDDALHDALTGLPNRVLFMEKLRLAHQRAKHHQTYSFAVLFVDLDRFKLLNDNLGHATGDAFLVQTGLRLKSSLRRRDAVARWGGDEFAILLDGAVDAAEAVEIAQRILDVLAAPHALDKQEMFTSASIGIAMSTLGYERPEDMLRDADTAMYRAKGAGQGRCEVFEHRMHDDGKLQLQLGGDLRRALERQQLSLYYQPTLDVASGRLTGCEALLRWNHPERGLVCPAEFIPLAEETGLILPLGEWVIRTACTQAAAWKQAGLPRLRMSINVSPRQVLQQQFAQSLGKLLEETGWAAQDVQLELTENLLLPDSEPGSQRIGDLIDLGVRIAVDDFGIGYSSPSYLRRLRVHAVKIDRSFVAALGKGETRSPEVLRGLVALAKSLDLEVTADGVESEEQWKFLRSVDCDLMQGFLCGQPLATEAFTQLLQREWHGDSAAGLPHPLRLSGLLPQVR